jgi:hypothetical protein
LVSRLVVPEVAMILDQVFERFVKGSPVSVMVRGTLENILHPDLINSLFQGVRSL